VIRRWVGGLRRADLGKFPYTKQLVRLRRDCAMSNIHVPRSFDPGLSDPATMVPTMPVRIRSIAWKSLSGAALVALSFWLTLQALEYLQSQWEPVGSNIILTYGDASASTISFGKDAKFRFPGNGYVELQDTRGLQCRTFNCSFSLAVSFAPIQADPQFIIGQSFDGQPGWHLLLGGGRLVLMTEGGTNLVGTPFVPKPGQRYQIDLARDDHEVTMSVDGTVAAKSKDIPFTDLARDVTIGGRPGPTLLALSASISDVQIAKQRPRPPTVTASR
jgi:hypothetical protein